MQIGEEPALDANDDKQDGKFTSSNTQTTKLNTQQLRSQSSVLNSPYSAEKADDDIDQASFGEMRQRKESVQAKTPEHTQAREAERIVLNANEYSHQSTNKANQNVGRNGHRSGKRQKE